MSKYHFKILRVFLFVLFLLMLGNQADRTMNREFSTQETSIQDNWIVSIDGTQYCDVSLDTFKFPSLASHSVITLQHVLNKKPFEQASVRILVEYSSIRAYLNGEQIYEKGTAYAQKGELLGAGYVWIELPEDYQGSTLTLELTTGETDAFTSIDSVILTNSSLSYKWLLAHRLITAIIAGFLLFFGVVCIMGTLFVGYSDKRFAMLFWLGFFSISIAIWMTCNGRLMQIFLKDFHLLCNIEYISMYLAFVSLPFFCSAFFREKKDRFLFHVLSLLLLGMEAVLIFLNCYNIFHYPKTVHIFQLTGILTILIIIWRLLKNVQLHAKKAERDLLIGIIIFVSFVIFELIRYRYNKICIPINHLNQSFIPVGVTFFILAMAGSFIHLLFERVAENMERKTLYDMAYQDSMTKLKNRAWCVQVMQDYDQQKKPISIINMDLNSFKSVNDTYGHIVGDQLLIHFGTILSSVFRETDCVGRMGGDEFIIILDYIPDSVIQAHMRTLLAKITEENEKHQNPYTLSVSYGYASDATGSELGSWKVYELADRRMYDYKHNYKEDHEL